MKANTLEIAELTKQFPNTKALNGASLKIPSGQIVGLLGPNASGKTTLLKIIAGLLTATSGEIIYPNGAKLGPESRGTIAFCPDILKFPRWMRVRDASRFYGEMYPDYRHDRANELSEILGLEKEQNTRIRALSKGMKERLILWLTFARKASLYLLDEPLDGIDPVGKAKVIDTIISMQPEGSSTLISTHLVKDVEKILDYVYFLSDGKTIFSESCETIREEKGLTVEEKYLEVFADEKSA